MPKEIYRKNIKKLDKEIKINRKRIIKLQDKRFKFIEGFSKGKKITMKQFSQNNANQKEIFNLGQEQIPIKRLRRKLQNKSNKLIKLERKGKL